MIRTAVEFDRHYYDDALCTDADICIQIYAKNPEIGFGALDPETHSVLGWLTFCPISYQAFAKLECGSPDNTLTTEDILTYSDNQWYYGYLADIVVHPSYQGQGIAHQLITVWRQFIVQLKIGRNIHFISILADAVTPAGNRLVRKLGFNSIGPSDHHSELFIL